MESASAIVPSSLTLEMSTSRSAVLLEIGGLDVETDDLPCERALDVPDLHRPSSSTVAGR